MINRSVSIRNFRNIGNDDFEVLELNTIIDKEDKMGGLVTLIGMNNSGKSNYLDALIYLKEKQIKETDKPLFNYSDNNIPIVSLWVSDAANSIKYEYTVKNNSIYSDKYDKNKKITINSNDKESSLKKIPDLINSMNLNNLANLNLTVDLNGKSVNMRNFIRDFISSQKKLETTYELQQLLSDQNVKFRYLQSGYINDSDYNKLLSNLSEVISILKEIEHTEILNNEVVETYGFNLIPNIVKYDDTKKITDADLVIIYENGKLKENNFYRLLFSYLDKVSFERFNDAYVNFHNSGAIKKFYLTNFEKEVNKELKNLADKFNRIYGTDQKQLYNFKVVIESNRTYFLLSENGNDVPLDNQSTGFKWFFNFFFNIFAGGNLKQGDIVILDEPATNLHVLGQKALRNQIKEFGINNGITFVISTHSPFLIDADYLDELRLVVKEGNNSRILNKFAEDFNGKDKVDSFLPIYTALTVDKHILLDPNNVLVFVEGITDYNYITAFKKLFNIEGISFLPFQGLLQKKLVNKLIKMSKKPVLLIDSDGAGINFEKNYEKNAELEVHMLEKINKEWKQIEDLFSPQDQKAFFTEDKKYNISSYFKSNIFNYENRITKKTKDNFKELLDYLKH